MCKRSGYLNAERLVLLSGGTKLKRMLGFIIDFTAGFMFNFSLFLIDFLFYKGFMYCKHCGRIKKCDV